MPALSPGADLDVPATTAPAFGRRAAPERPAVVRRAAGDPTALGDAEFDGVLAAVIERGEVPLVNRALRVWTRNDQPVPPGLPDDLHDALVASGALPAWADADALARAARFAHRTDPHLTLLYGLGSRIMGTIDPRSARAVYWSEGGAGMDGRAAKNALFGRALAAPGAFSPSGGVVVAARKTRIVHAAMRHLLPRSPYWSRTADEAVPITQRDLLAAFHCTGTFAHRRLRQSGIAMTDAEEHAFLHSWQVALHLLGVRNDLIPADWQAAHAQAAALPMPSVPWSAEGRALADTLLTPLDDEPLGVSRGFLNEFLRHQLGGALADWLGLRRDFESARLIRLGWPVYTSADDHPPSAPVELGRFDDAVRRLTDALAADRSGLLATTIEIPEPGR